MKAVGLYRYLDIEDSESLLDLELEVPVPEARDLLVRVKAVSVNPVDTKQRAPKERVEATPRVLGYDAVGEVVKVGRDVNLFAVGDEVYFAGDVTRQGSNAEYTRIDERLAAHKPQNLTASEAAAMPLTTLTASEALFDRLLITPEKDKGKSILIINGAGGVGSIAVQLAKFSGLEVIATASRPETIDWVKQHGADFVIDHHLSIPEELMKIGFPHVDYILCLHDTYRHFEAMEQAIKPEGQICSIVELSHPVQMSILKDKSAGFHYEFMFTRSKYQMADQIRQHEILEKARVLFESGELKSTLTKVLTPINAETMREAHKIVESGKMIGKLVVKGFDEDDK
ncbi:zinc-binding alcohol dehydrogenase family protein [Listeria aquatica]|uniref:Zinc-type alcohol dehydrogenase-like protein n=1 Tax=Listeria aquatica TaxID=1494960 RepID=A0A841ZP26_9LIST|nr:zinc-binding alcohol dehydrogenase family protein [Listeria aquatica]MBC1521903.1 zinc-binding alcohol dehydrogenase family protein [Listeria aquatica]